MQIIELREFEPLRIPADAIPVEYHGVLHERLEPHVAVQYPSPKTDGCWELTSQGYVGFLPVGREFGISLQPKVPLSNLFRMLEVAFDLGEFKFLDGLKGFGSLDDFYEHLAMVFAQRVLARAQRGFYREYLNDTERLAYIRGRLDVVGHSRSPFTVSFPCEFQDHTADLPDNQLVAWTLRSILYGATCSDRLRLTTRRAYQGIREQVSLFPYTAADCVGRLYNRLNEDYRALHVLCRFFLESSGPTHKEGEREVMPFLVDMSSLFERFVARWLIMNPPAGLKPKAQEIVRFGVGNTVRFKMDIVMEEENTGNTTMVMDTKYKVTETPSSDDIQQVVAYAAAQKCSSCALIYPKMPPTPFNHLVGDIQVQTLSFEVDCQLEASGKTLLSHLERS